METLFWYKVGWTICPFGSIYYINHYNEKLSSQNGGTEGENTVTLLFKF